MEDDKHLHINIFKDNKQQIEAASNMSEAFIIKANEELNNKLRVVLDELSTVRAEQDTLLEDNERMEVTVTNQRGLLHNFNGLKNHETKRADLFMKMYENHKELVKSMNEHEKKLQAHQSYSGLVYAGITIMFFILGLVDFTSLVSFTLALVTSFYGTQHITGFNKNEIKQIHKNFQDKENRVKDSIRKVEANINEITSKNDFISDFIDGV
tara:strand:- start:53 stop:685 length:633 start_codon:yes stop_codon:yes gene_type:complete